MDKEDFNKLSIDEQFNYLNKQLDSDNISRAALFKRIGLAKSTIADRARNNNYKFDTTINKYILDEGCSKRTANNSPDEIEKTDCNAKVSTSVSNEKTVGIQLDSISHSNLIYLLENTDKIKLLLEQKDRNNNDIETIEDIISDVYNFKQVKERKYDKVKSLRLDQEILDGFETMVSLVSKKGINQQEFLNYILSSYIKFFNKIAKEDILVKNI